MWIKASRETDNTVDKNIQKWIGRRKSKSKSNEQIVKGED